MAEKKKKKALDMIQIPDDQKEEAAEFSQHLHKIDPMSQSLLQSMVYLMDALITHVRSA